MPETEYIPLAEAKRRTSAKKRVAILTPYFQALSDLTADRAGVMTASTGETVQAVRRRLGAAAKLMQVELKISKQESKIYFWSVGPRRKGRPRKII